MSRIVDVEYVMKVYCRVNLDTGEIEKVITDDEGIEPTGNSMHALGSDPVTEADIDEAAEIASGDQDWPPWDRGY
jgi:hypothetical protein